LGHVRFVLEVLEDEGDPGEVVAVADFMTPGFAAIALTGDTIGSDAAVRIRARAGPLVAGPTVAAIRGTIMGRGVAEGMDMVGGTGVGVDVGSGGRKSHELVRDIH
jgi:hypothetical protein